MLLHELGSHVTCPQKAAAKHAGCLEFPYKSMLGQATIATTIVATRPTSSHISRRGTLDTASCKEWHSPGSSTGASFHSTGEGKAARQPAMLCSSCLESRVIDPIDTYIAPCPAAMPWSRNAFRSAGRGFGVSMLVGPTNCSHRGYIHAVLIPGATPDTCRCLCQHCLTKYAHCN